MKRTGAGWIIVLVLALAMSAGRLEAQRGRGMRGGGRGLLPLSIIYEYFPSTGLSQPGNDFPGRGLKIGITNVEFGLTIPQFGGMGRRDRDTETPRRWFIIHRLGYLQRQVRYENPSLSDPARQANRLHAAYYQLALAYRHSPRWSLMFQAKPGLYGDFHGKLNREDWKLEGELLLDRVLESGFVIGLGAVYTQDLGEPIALPAVHLESGRMANPHLRVNAPSMAEVSWFFYERGIELGAGTRLDGGQYSLGEFDNTAAPRRINRLRYSCGTAGLFARFRTGGMWRLGLETGGTFHRRFESYLEGTRVTKYPLKNSTYLRLSLQSGP